MTLQDEHRQQLDDSAATTTNAEEQDESPYATSPNELREKRTAYLRSLEDGWRDGFGKAPDESVIGAIMTAHALLPVHEQMQWWIGATVDLDSPNEPSRGSGVIMGRIEDLPWDQNQSIPHLQYVVDLDFYPDRYVIGSCLVVADLDEQNSGSSFAGYFESQMTPEEAVRRIVAMRSRLLVDAAAWNGRNGWLP